MSTIKAFLTAVAVVATITIITLAASAVANASTGATLTFGPATPTPAVARQAVIKWFHNNGDVARVGVCHVQPKHHRDYCPARFLMEVTIRHTTYQGWAYLPKFVSYDKNHHLHMWLAENPRSQATLHLHRA